jgi:hypothetical protein
VDEHVFEIGEAAETGVIGAPTPAVVLRLLERVEPFPAGAPTAALGDEALGWLAVAERATALAVRFLGGFDAAGGAAEAGSTSTTAWVAAHGSMSRASAARLVGAARLAHHHPDTAKALEAGDVSVAHLEVAGTATRPAGYAELYARDEAVIVDAARDLPVDDFARVLRYWADLADDHLGRDRAARAHDRRSFTLSLLPDGSAVPAGRLDPTTTALLTAALHHTMGTPDPDPPPGDGPPPRTTPQRRCDALAELARAHLSGANQRAGAPVATVDVVVDLHTLTGTPPTDLTTTRSDVTGLGPVPRTTIETLLCDSWAGRILLRGRSEILDVGRRTRTFTPTQRRALIARDGPGCTHPGCDRPATWCDTHHDHHWAHGGPTDHTNARLLCRWHHTWHHHHTHPDHRTPPGRGP